MADTNAELLAILSTVRPLLLPDLPSPPPSPSPSHTVNGKRKHESLSDDPKPRAESDVQNDSKRSRPPPPRPPPPPAPPSIDLKPPTPELSKSRLPPPPPAPASASMKGSPRLGSTSLAGGGEPEWRKEWPKERLRKLGAQCRDHGRRLKHSGDSLARRSTSPQATLLALVHQLDAILLYVFSFWCDDTAAKTCLNANWTSVFGLIGFVKKVCEKENQSFLGAICMRMEAITIYTLSMHEQKALFYKATQLSHSPSPSAPLPPAPSSIRLPPGPPPPPPPPAPNTAPSPSSSSTTTAASPLANSPPNPSSLPPKPPPPPSHASTPSLGGGREKQFEEFLKLFLKASPDLFRFQKLYDESCLSLPPSPSNTTSTTTTTTGTGEFVLPNLGEKEMGLVELARGSGSIMAGFMVPSQVGWCRNKLGEWCREREVDYEFVRIGEGV